MFSVLVMVPASTYAQATLAGVVKDSSGAVLPGVTVEAASPVLIEKARSAVTDGTGQYQIVDLRPGAYSVTYTVPKVDVLVSAIIRSQPNSSFGFGATPEGNSTGLSAVYATTVNGQAANVNLLQPGVYFGDRINQLDARFGKVLRFGRSTSSVAVDFLNLFNSNTGTAFQTNYGNGSGYLAPTAILNPRLARFNVTIDF